MAAAASELFNFTGSVGRSSKKRSERGSAGEIIFMVLLNVTLSQ